jgi:hypothetical protein
VFVRVVPARVDASVRRRRGLVLDHPHHIETERTTVVTKSNFESLGTLPPLAPAVMKELG